MSNVAVNQMGFGAVGTNWHGSYPTFLADATFEPNFRQFSMNSTDINLPQEALAEKLLKSKDGGMSPLMSVTTWQLRNWPTMISALTLSVPMAFMTTSYYGRSIRSAPWHYIRFTAVIFAFTNVQRWCIRESRFKKDFEQNQLFAFEEVRAQRDEKRVAEILFASEFVNDAIAEYRVKNWQAARVAR